MATIKIKKGSNGTATPADTAPASDNSFEHGGKKYKVTKAAKINTGNGAQVLTAADICVSTEAQEYLVANGCSCIEEVIE